MNVPSPIPRSAEFRRESRAERPPRCDSPVGASKGGAAGTPPRRVKSGQTGGGGAEKEKAARQKAGRHCAVGAHQFSPHGLHPSVIVRWCARPGRRIVNPRPTMQRAAPGFDTPTRPACRGRTSGRAIQLRILQTITARNCIARPVMHLLSGPFRCSKPAGSGSFSGAGVHSARPQPIGRRPVLPHHTLPPQQACSGGVYCRAGTPDG